MARSIAGSRRGRSPLWIVLVTLLVPLLPASHARAQNDLQPSAAPDDPCPEGPDFFVFAEQTDLRRTDLFLVGGDGAGKVRLTFDQASEDPDITPDGRRIVYTHGSGGWQECCGFARNSIWVMGSDGSPGRPLVDGDHDREPAVSPDGRTVAFVRDDDQGGGRLHVVPIEGGEPRPVFPEAAPGAIDRWPVWSPDGGRIAFVRLSSDRMSQTLIVVGADGSVATEVPDTRPDGWFDWSPDGTRLVLPTIRSRGLEVDVVDVATGASDTIHPDGWHPRWLSPRKIVLLAPAEADSWDAHLTLVDPATHATDVLDDGPHVRGYFGFSRLDAHCG